MQLSLHAKFSVYEHYFQHVLHCMKKSFHLVNICSVCKMFYASKHFHKFCFGINYTPCSTIYTRTLNIQLKISQIVLLNNHFHSKSILPLLKSYAERLRCFTQLFVVICHLKISIVLFKKSKFVPIHSTSFLKTSRIAQKISCNTISHIAVVYKALHFNTIGLVKISS